VFVALLAIFMFSPRDFNPFPAFATVMPISICPFVEESVHLAAEIKQRKLPWSRNGCPYVTL
jgi:hypothetical protein